VLASMTSMYVSRSRWAHDSMIVPLCIVWSVVCALRCVVRNVCCVLCALWFVMRGGVTRASRLDFGLTAGGPTSLVWGWILSFVCIMIVSLSMAEICGVFPSSGGSL
jgi:hypothetical protein